MTPDHQKFMAFEGLLGWTAAVVSQAQRVTAAHDNWLAEIQRGFDVQFGRGPDVILRERLAQQSFQTERHLFCNAAYQLLEHRKWVQGLGFLDDALFEELDKFARDINVMRDMNEHVVEYFEGKGKRPHDWFHQGGDASGTSGTKFGGRLDWIELGAAAGRLLEEIKSLGPFFPPTPTTPEEWVEHIKSLTST